MPDYKTMYQILCVAADKAVTVLEEQHENRLAAEILKEALLRAEAVYIETADEL